LETLKKYDEARILEDWSKVEAERIEPSKKILTLEWHKRRNDASIRAVTNLLEDWKSRTPFADVLSVFPCCATTTLSVGNKIPLSPGMFDMAVIDEASQADVASCLPILHRARRAIIIGDEMQLRPIVTLPEPKNEELLQAFGLEGEKFRRYDFRTSSMLDLAYDRFTAAGGRRLVLKDHYRCHPDIISYSNRCFYDGCLRIRTSRNTGPGLYLHPCEGEAHPRWRNPAEIDIVLTLVTRTLAAGYGHAQIGVVTPFRQQAEAIINRLRNEDLFEGDSGIVAVSTAHGFQGDERDVMILSLVVANNMPSGTIKWIHDINTDSKNLLNVAVTRARRELHVVANEKVCTSAGGLLRELMAHCRSHSDHDQTKRTPN
jgi:superfamily I DNA and/or RNA helicase